MSFLLALVVDGALTGAVYALAALAFVVVYKASGVVNFALGEWLVLGSRLPAAAVHAALGLTAAAGAGAAGTAALGGAFSRLVLARLIGQPPIALIMVTLGLGTLLRGAMPIALRGVPAGVALPLPAEALVVHGVPIAAGKLVAALAAALAIAGVLAFFRASRTGVALRAIADDQQVALTVGIDVQRYFALTWALMAALSVLAGTLWTAVTGGGFGVVLLGLKVFPIVILGGLDSVAGAVVAALGLGVLESVVAGYLDPLVGGGFSSVAAYLVLLAVLFVRPHGLFGSRA
ncbi:MAG TPA: branched-chain amino acid ABC transporter permease [Methylomirabilota bacterium]|nr:branched-chain amino acid ABC transporter permease [Methylomirabilota bacterium]